MRHLRRTRAASGGQLRRLPQSKDTRLGLGRSADSPGARLRNRREAVSRSAKLLLAPRPLDIGDTAGFEKSDIFQAKAPGERLANIVGDLAGHAVIVLDGPWGSGKSVFARQWAGLLRQRGHAVVYFDAFEHDHLDDAFFPLFGHLLKASDSSGPRLKDSKASLVRTATPLVRAMPRIVADAALRTGTGGLLSLADLQQHVRDARSAETDDIEAFVEESLEQAATQVECVDGFRDALAAAVANTGDGEQGKAPLVFVIDELDRCRPSYALNVLERVKHLFTVDGICFVLVTHLEGLAAMVKRAYGLEKADQYLDKFFQLRFDIRRILSRGPETSHTRYLRHLAELMGLSWNHGQNPTMTINSLVQVHDLTFRSQERLMLNLALLKRSKGGFPNEIHRALSAGLCVMRTLAPELYHDAARERLGYRDAMAFLKFDQWPGVGEETIDRIKRYWTFSAADGEEHLTAEERANWSSATFYSGRREMAEICADIDLLW
ncbi:MAG: hypothetical protein F4Z59_06895 [Gemmatimonadales bacterium]|nr:hypothetical protein [Gemmatimonadales bacterium]